MKEKDSSLSLSQLPVKMFSNQSPSKTNIDEANRHLQMLHSYVEELEERIQTQAVEHQRQIEENESRFRFMVTQKDAEILKLKDQLESNEEQCKDMEKKLQAKDVLLTGLQMKSKRLDEINSYGPAITELASLLTGSVLRSCHEQKHFQSSERNGPNNLMVKSATKKAYSVVDEVDEIRRTWQRQNVEQGPAGLDRLRHFSISGSDAEDDCMEGNNVCVPLKPEKELYL